ncbi:MAG: SMP-30/gluconolactonase/LRE family protein [Candidatus Nanopelagicales bacterium]|nr:SMP-30/gluconolactonase/LRE family protein [Candidatus Nanopelagicales bacterium]
MSKPSIDPATWQPPGVATKPPAFNLPALNILPVPGAGPEDALFVDDRIISGLEDGRIVSVSLDGWQIEVLADTKGRPLGIEAHPDGIVICDAEKGLLLLQGGELTTLVAKGQHGLRVCNNAAVAADGTIYFTDSSQRFDLEHWTADIIEHSGTGRLLRRSPDGTVDVLAEGLQFANGVALTPEFVAVAQTGLYCVDRVWLADGKHEPWITNLPAFPDNIAAGDEGLVWVTLASARKSALDKTAGKPFLRKVIWALPEALHPKPDNLVWVRAYDTGGKMVHEFCGEHEQFYMCTGVRAHGGKVAMGSLTTTALAWFELPG